ncbi:dienelactone hydrolase family protein [Vitiosangium sp. GDMCC 1.1324]|uniref:dienelactone hydrolase family protein n=1 Tax=Vitiosangium sp. (strain GDMCC 1.1324) TaxID=2138576 RepID=UPI000D3C374F|nr:dienelactone hydrolase family protein [Vitiosangium sp. GDMCC 1.1324]PTL79871.1 dienelactone hydrolase [Vitiosangium sp. GDMCC 1.1324]
MPADISPNLHTEYLDYAEADAVFEAYVAYPKESGHPRPCVLVAHEWSGLNGATRATAEKLAGLGYVGFALDVYGKGVRGSETGDNSRLMGPLMADRALLRRRLLAGLAAARRHPAVDTGRMAAIGHCFGGLCVLDLARAAPPDLRGVVSFHGVLQPPGLGAQAPITSRVLILHGWEDPVAPPADVVAVARELTGAGAAWELHAYGHAQHAFTFKGANMPERGIVHHPEADRRSWAAMRTFLTEVFS